VVPHLAVSMGCAVPHFWGERQSARRLESRGLALQLKPSRMRHRTHAQLEIGQTLGNRGALENAFEGEAKRNGLFALFQSVSRSAPNGLTAKPDIYQQVIVDA
jgi:hypothetical protein